MQPRHPFHLVDSSPWPFIGSMGALTFLFGIALWFHSFWTGPITMLLGLTLVLLVMHVWWTDVIDERILMGYHTKSVKLGLRLGVALFILSEVMFFFSFFWGFFHSSLIPDIAMGSEWPPMGMTPLLFTDVPLTNTILLLSSGVTLTWSHHAIILNNREESIIGLLFTLILAVLFTLFQLDEYTSATFDITDGIYGSTFYMMTGFHGMHVIIGTMFLTVCLMSTYKWHFSPGHHFGFEAAAWYWHFVDVVWLILFLFVYGWASLQPNTEEVTYVISSLINDV